VDQQELSLSPWPPPAAGLVMAIPFFDQDRRFIRPIAARPPAPACGAAIATTVDAAGI
jgi:hypothetical protein